MSTDDTVNDGYCIMQACWCCCTLVLTLLYCNQFYRWHTRCKLPPTSQYAPTTCTKLFLIEASIVLPLWIVKSIDPYSQNGIINSAYTKFVGDIVPACGVTLTACMIDSLLRSVAITSSEAEQLNDHLRKVQLLLYIPAVCMLLLAVVVTPVAFAESSDLTQGLFMLCLVAVFTSQWLMLNYSGWRLRIILTAHTEQDVGRDHHAIDAALTKLWKLQLLWTTLYVFASVGCIMAGTDKLDSSRPWDGGYHFERQTVTVDYFEWMLVLGFAFLYFYCWLPPLDSSRVSVSIVPASPRFAVNRQVTKSEQQRGSYDHRTPIRRTYSTMDAQQLAAVLPITPAAGRRSTYTPMDVNQLAVAVPMQRASFIDSVSELERQPISSSYASTVTG